MAIVPVGAGGGRSSTVFVGNIAYDTPESELKEIFGRAGKVASLRMVYDKDTKQPKGYGFCDYTDPDSAMNAVRELNDAECNGRRLRIDLADIALRGRDSLLGAPKPLSAPASLPLPPGSGGPPGSSGPPGSMPPRAPPLSLPPGVLPPKAPGSDPVAEGLGAGGMSPEALLSAVSAHTEIAQTVAAMPQAQLQLCLGTMQRLAVEAPEHARAMLQDNPQMCYALLHAQLLLGLTLEPSTMPDTAECAKLRAEAVSHRPMGLAFPPGSGVVVPPALHMTGGRGPAIIAGRPGFSSRPGFPVGVRPPVQPLGFAAPTHAWATAPRPVTGPRVVMAGLAPKAAMAHPYST